MQPDCKLVAELSVILAVFPIPVVNHTHHFELTVKDDELSIWCKCRKGYGATYVPQKIASSASQQQPNSGRVDHGLRMPTHDRAGCFDGAVDVEVTGTSNGDGDSKRPHYLGM